MQVLVNDQAIVLPRAMSENEFFEFCTLNRDRRIERTAEGDVIVMPPTGLDTGDQNADLTAQLRTWAKQDRRGVAFDNNTGFTLPNGAVRSPGAAWILRARLAKLTLKDRQRQELF